MHSNTPITNDPRRFHRLLACTAVLALCLAWLYRQQLSNGFALVAGDRYDGVISTTILEHWYQVFLGRANWAEVGYFFPYTRVIAQSDASFLVGVLYTPFRLLGYDPFLSAELANIAMKSIGFISAYLMCRKVFSLSFPWALLAAVLFTLSNGMAAHASRAQLATVALTPLLVLLIWHGVKSLGANQVARFRIDGVLAGALYGAWCLTCFYDAWFFLFFFTVFAVVAALLGGRAGLARMKQIIAKHYWSILFVLGSAVFWLLPFLYAYLPKARETGVRLYDEALRYTVPLEHVLQVGNANLVWGKIYNKLLLQVYPGYAPEGEYFDTGVAAGLFVLFVCAVVQYIRKPNRQLVLSSILLATLLTWLLILNVGGWSPWIYVFTYFPGAKALRVVAAYQIFLALPVIVLAVSFLSTLRPRAPVAALVAAVLVAEELNATGLGLDRGAELARIALPQAPPARCHSFYTSGWNDQDRLPFPAGIYAHNVTAMLIAQHTKIPTVNGVASFMAKDWDFARPNAPDYDARVASYASKHGLSGLCKLDLNDKSWKVIADSALVRLPLDVKFFEKSAWPGGIAEMRGLSGPEPWGAWSNDKLVQLQFTAPLPEKFALHLTGHAFAHNIGKAFLVQLEGKRAGNASLPVPAKTFVLGGTDEERVLSFENPARANTINIIVPQPVSPIELGAASDDRHLGIALAKFRIEPLDDGRVAGSSKPSGGPDASRAQAW
jgi:hypothetical protein